jgi:hypothetical protein
LREVTGEPAGEPHGPPAQPVVTEPGDDLLEVLHPRPPTTCEPEPMPGQRTGAVPLELTVRSLVERLQTAPASEREQLEREIGLLLGRIRARQPGKREREPQRDQKPRTLIEEVHAVPEANRKATTEVQPPPQRRRAHRTGASVESCEIRIWRGYVKYRLYASLRGSDIAFAESRYFRLPDEEAPNAGAQRALADLLAELEQGGWTVVSGGASWYQHQLQRSAR